MTTVTRAHLAEVVYGVQTASHVSRNEAAGLIDEVLNQIAKALVAGEVAKIPNFGMFATLRKGSRQGRNPKRPEQLVTIEPRRVAVFKGIDRAARPGHSRECEVTFPLGLQVDETGMREAYPMRPRRGRRQAPASLLSARDDQHSTLGYVARVWEGSDGEATRRLYERLQALGTLGAIAVNLFRANKTSSRAKAYRGRQYKDASYDRKEWSVGNVALILASEAAAAGIVWGWKHDPGTPGFTWVVYVDLPTGQVSFHQATRGSGPDYPGQWDGERSSAERIVRWCADLLDGRVSEPPAPPAAAQATPTLEPPQQEDLPL